MSFGSLQSLQGVSWTERGKASCELISTVDQAEDKTHAQQCASNYDGPAAPNDVPAVLGQTQTVQSTVSAGQSFVQAMQNDSPALQNNDSSARSKAQSTSNEIQGVQGNLAAAQRDVTGTHNDAQVPQTQEAAAKSDGTTVQRNAQAANAAHITTFQRCAMPISMPTSSSNTTVSQAINKAIQSQLQTFLSSLGDETHPGQPTGSLSSAATCLDRFRNSLTFGVPSAINAWSEAPSRQRPKSSPTTSLPQASSPDLRSSRSQSVPCASDKPRIMQPTTSGYSLSWLKSRINRFGNGGNVLTAPLQPIEPLSTFLARADPETNNAHRNMISTSLTALVTNPRKRTAPSDLQDPATSTRRLRITRPAQLNNTPGRDESTLQHQHRHVWSLVHYVTPNTPSPPTTVPAMHNPRRLFAHFSDANTAAWAHISGELETMTRDLLAAGRGDAQGLETAVQIERNEGGGMVLRVALEAGTLAVVEIGRVVVW